MWKSYELGQLLTYEQPTPYIVESTEYCDNYIIPVLTAGKSFILGYTNETHGVYNALPVIIFDDFTTASQYVNFKFKVKSSAMKILTPNTELVLPKFIYYRMQIIQFDHSTHKRYWIQQYSKIKVAVPTIPVQEQIVARIEELFSELDNGVETLRKTKQQLAVYRQAVLKDSFDRTGETQVPLKQIIEKPRYGTSKKCSCDTTANSVPVYRIPNVNYLQGTISHDDLKYAMFTEDEYESLRLNVGDILIIRSNGSVSLVGRSAVISEKDIHGLFAGYLMRLRIKSGVEVLPQYLNLYLNTHYARNQIEQMAKSTSGVNNINSDEICRICLPICDIDMQKEIIQEIESRLSVCDSIEKTVDTALQQAEAMRQSILKQAFEGNL